MHYTYILQSISNPNKTYIGYSSNLKQRLLDHNSNKSNYTKQFSPWKIKNYFAFEEKQHAINFEKYLKSGSGKSFIKRHFP